MSDQEKVPANALFVCFGVMSSAGTLTGVAALEAMKKLDPKKTGLFCTSALAVDVPKHKKTTQAAKRIIAVDGCANRCASKIIEKSGFKVDRSLNLDKDLGIEKRGPFRCFDYTLEELHKAVEAIVKICEEES
ncbi:MAG: putative zinc-binding protein [Thermodesulfobacteriota bacterium]